jgi:orotate phosphoribosyltransferase-like protein
MSVEYVFFFKPLGGIAYVTIGFECMDVRIMHKNSVHEIEKILHIQCCGVPFASQLVILSTKMVPQSYVWSLHSATTSTQTTHL